MVVPPSAEVVVVGGGPAGSSTASHLARAGVDVVLIDKARFPREKACAEYCSPGVVDELDALGALDRVRSVEHQSLRSMRVVALGQEISLNFGSERPDGNEALGIKRSVLDAELLSLAEEHGATVLQGVRAKSAVTTAGRVTGVLVRDGDGEHEIKARFVVAADGLHSTIARTLGLNLPLRWPKRLGLVARFSGLSEQIHNGQMHIGDGIYSGISPVGQDKVNVSLVVPMGAKPPDIRTGEYFDDQVRSLPGVAAVLRGAHRISNVRGLGPMGKRVSNRAGPGYILVGDAAGFFDPLTGEGIHRALQGGRLASQTVLIGLNSEDRLPVGYEDARSKAFGDKERVCKIIQGLIISPRVLRYVAARASQRVAARSTLCGILGDYEPARNAFAPSFLWNLMKP